MKKLLVLLLPLALVLSGCSGLSVGTPSSVAAAAGAESVKQIAKTGVVVTGGNVFGKWVVNGFRPNYKYFVNDAVMYGSKAEIRQFRRSSELMPSELGAVLSLLSAEVGATVAFPTGDAKILAKHVSNHGSRFVQVAVTLRDAYSGRKTHGVVGYQMADGHVTQVVVSKRLLPSGNIQEICYYYPANCLTHIKLKYEPDAVISTMDTARRHFEHKWLRKAQVRAFETLLAATQNSYAALPSWTTVSTDQRQGSIYDADTNRGVWWDQYDPATKFSSATSGIGPDLGLVSATFFDNTDGGSNFFYAGIFADQTKRTFTVINQDGTPAAVFRLSKNRLTSISNYVITKYTVHISGKVNRGLLARKIASAQ